MRWWRRPAVSFGILSIVWTLILLRQYSLVQKIHVNVTGASSSIPQAPASLPPPRKISSQSPLAKGAPPKHSISDTIVKEHQQNQQGSSAQTTNSQSKHDGTFNNVPIVLRRRAPSSAVHCVGGDGRPTNVSWMFRSCQFQYLCMNMNTNDYVLVRDDKHEDWLPPRQEAATNFTDHAVSLGGINPRWGAGKGFNKGIWKVKWFPTIIDASSVSGFYELPSDYVMLPFHSFAAHNVGHLLWDDFYPMFSLLRLFDLLPGETEKQLLPIRQQVKLKLYATCDIRPKKRKECQANLQKFLPLMGVDPSRFSTNKQIQLETNSGFLDSQFVCAKTAVAGLGMLTDHGMRDHGWIESNGTKLEWVPHNLGRGATFFQFRQFMLTNLLGKPKSTELADGVPRVIFSRLSSQHVDRRLNFTRQVDYLRESLPETEASIEPLTLWELDMEEQIQLTLNAHIFVSTCGGGSMTATFLPRGATLILFYNPVGGFDFFFDEFVDGLNGKVARLDWDLMNHASHLRVHWLPLTTMDTPQDLELLLVLIQHELEIIKSLRYM